MTGSYSLTNPRQTDLKPTASVMKSSAKIKQGCICI